MADWHGDESPPPLRGRARGGGASTLPSRLPPPRTSPHEGEGNGAGMLEGASRCAHCARRSPLSDASAQTKRVRPAEEQPEHYPDGPNRETTFYFCTACHSFKIVAAQGMSRERWDESLTWMVERHRMPEVKGEERDKILDYLAAAFPERTQPGGWKNPFTGK